MITKSNGYKVSWLIFGILFLIGIFLTDVHKEEYSTSEYWVAKNYSHVYEQYSGEIVDVIEADEKCTVKEDKIIVERKKYGETWHAIGCTVAGISSMFLIGLIVIFVQELREESKQI